MYAIVDIETTGTYAAAHGITEISIYISDGKRIVQKFESLVNPCQPIPWYIQSFTGISNEMVARAPLFEEIADKVFALLQDKIFVAHNVNFDYSFIKAALLANGYDYYPKRLCTVRLSRKIFPGLPSYSLGNLCHSLGIKIRRRHRAGGDAEATAKILHKLLQHDTEKHIEKSLLRNSKENMLPPHVPKEQFDRLPETPGIYYFHNEKGKIIYIGKARNIRQRVNSHFSSGWEQRQKQNFLRHTHSISFQSCATELMAIILESTEIKKHWPAFNHSQKRWDDVYGIYSFTDQNGYMRLAIEKNKKHIQPVFRFHYLADGYAVMRRLIRDYQLCPKLCFMQSDHIPCTGQAEGTCRGSCQQKENPQAYNERVLQAIGSLQTQPTFFILDKGPNEHERSCIMVENGKLYGMGYIREDADFNDLLFIKSQLTPLKENSFIKQVLQGYTARYPHQVFIPEPASIQSSH